MLRKAIILFALFSTISCGAGRNSERLEMRKSGFIEQWDQNDDGIVTCGDDLVRRSQQFKDADLDASDLLDVKEIREAPWGSKAFAAEVLATYDLNRNGTVDIDEFLLKQEGLFAKIDVDQDCLITDEEISASLKERPGKRPGNGRRGQRGGLGGGSGGGRPQ